MREVCEGKNLHLKAQYVVSKLHLLLEFLQRMCFVRHSGKSVLYEPDLATVCLDFTEWNINRN